MTSTGIRLEYALEGTTNFLAWKICMEVVLGDNGLLCYINKDIVKPYAVNA